MEKIRYQDADTFIELVRVRPTSKILTFIKDKTQGIFRRYPRLEGLRVNVKRDSTGRTTNDYTARARLILPGHDRIVEKRGNDLFAAIAHTLEVADRQLRKRSRRYKMKLRHGVS